MTLCWSWRWGLEVCKRWRPCYARDTVSDTCHCQCHTDVCFYLPIFFHLVASTVAETCQSLLQALILNVCQFRLVLLLRISFLSLLYNASRARDTRALPHFSYLASLWLVSLLHDLLWLMWLCHHYAWLVWTLSDSILISHGPIAIV